jgi:hypothetical protein
MCKWILSILVWLCFTSTEAQKIKLSQPKNDHELVMIPKGRVYRWTYEFRMEGAEIRYTLDGKDPDQSSALYTIPLTFENETTIKVRTFHKNFLPSDVVTTRFIKQNTLMYVDSISTPHAKYPGYGLNTIRNKRFGTKDFSKEYLGYNGDTIRIKVSPRFKQQDIKKVNISYISHQGAWIFGPSKIELHDNYGKYISEVITAHNEKEKTIGHGLATIDIPESMLSEVYYIYIYPQSSIPEWHPGKGNKAWLFIDEIWAE